MMKSFRFYIKDKNKKSSTDILAILFSFFYLSGDLVVFLLMNEDKKLFAIFNAVYLPLLLFIFKKIKGKSADMIYIISIVIIGLFYSIIFM